MRKAAMQRKTSFMDDLPPEEGMPVEGVAMDGMEDDYGQYLEDDFAMEDELDPAMDMEARVATLEERIAALEAMLAG